MDRRKATKDPQHGSDSTPTDFASCPHPWADELLEQCLVLLGASDIDECMDRIRDLLARHGVSDPRMEGHPVESAMS